MYTEREIYKALERYGETESVTATIIALGYPSRSNLYRWIKNQNLPPKEKKKNRGVNTHEHPRHPPVDLKLETIYRCFELGEDVKSVSEEIGYSRASIYAWRRTYVRKGAIALMNEKDIARGKLTEGSSIDTKELEQLKEEVQDMRMEIDILKETIHVLKKDPGIDQTTLRNREKAAIVDALKSNYSLPPLLRRLGLSKSSYYYQESAFRRQDKHAALRRRIVELFEENKNRYGYRRIHGLLKREETTVSEKVVRRIMREEKLADKSKRSKRYDSYRGEVSPAVPNKIERDFHADKHNKKWLTDITEFAIPAGKVYLSPIVDCFDGMLPCWTISRAPDSALVNVMLDQAIAQLPKGARPIIHSDRGCHYRWPGWIERMEKAGLERSMSKKGCSPDNAACEGLFGRLKNEMFYDRDWTDVSVPEFIDILNEYLVWYNEKRIKTSLGNMSPKEYRQNLGLTA